MKKKKLAPVSLGTYVLKCDVILWSKCKNWRTKRPDSPYLCIDTYLSDRSQWRNRWKSCHRETKGQQNEINPALSPYKWWGIWPVSAPLSFPSWRNGGGGFVPVSRGPDVMTASWGEKLGYREVKGWFHTFLAVCPWAGGLHILSFSINKARKYSTQRIRLLLEE